MTIRHLPDTVINQIAAGEVIERPASAVKELMENAIDAGADRIAVTIKRGGKTLIRVDDNGTGMTRDDLSLCTIRHTTSKLANLDLMAIRSLGFRGEALASISAVARLHVVSRHASEDNGWGLRVEAGAGGDVAPAALSKGTRVEVLDLFFATPARLKFLKSDQAESNAVTGVVKRIAIAHPGIHFTLVNNDRTRLDYPSVRTDDAQLVRIGQVLGPEFQANAVPVMAEREGLTLTGYVGLPTFTRANTLSQFAYVNTRPLRDKMIAGAIRGAYADVLHRDRFPVVVLFITIAPKDVDINVHPAKSDVRFRNPGLVRGLIISAIRHALGARGTKTASTLGEAMLGAMVRQPHGPGTEQTPSPRTAGATRYYQRLGPRAPFPQNSPHRPLGFSESLEASAAGAVDEPSAHVEPLGDGDGNGRGRDAELVASYPLGAARAQVHETYIIAQTRDGLAIVDQHAAHERLVYERLKDAYTRGKVTTQMLLIPEIIEMDQEDVEQLLAHKQDLEDLGLVLEGFGPGAVSVSETPALLGETDVTGLVKDLADNLNAWGDISLVRDKLDAVASRMACHGSIRAGRRLQASDMNALLREMEATPLSGQCNHGRPTYVELKLHDIERLFGRR